jgi:hypothetical protein
MPDLGGLRASTVLNLPEFQSAVCAEKPTQAGYGMLIPICFLFCQRFASVFSRERVFQKFSLRSRRSDLPQRAKLDFIGCTPHGGHAV